eukprot:2463577-Rhodomonas_salina.4
MVRKPFPQTAASGVLMTCVSSSRCAHHGRRLISPLMNLANSSLIVAAPASSMPGPPSSSAPQYSQQLTQTKHTSHHSNNTQKVAQRTVSRLAVSLVDAVELGEVVVAEFAVRRRARVAPASVGEVVPRRRARHVGARAVGPEDRAHVLRLGRNPRAPGSRDARVRTGGGKRLRWRGVLTTGAGGAQKSP